MEAASGPSDGGPTQPSTPAATPRAYYYVSSTTFRLAWAGIVAVLSSVYLFLACYVALYSATYAVPNIEYLVSTFQLLGRSQYPLVASTYGLVSVLFLRSLVNILSASVRNKQLSFSAADVTNPSTKFRSKWMCVRVLRRRSRPLRRAVRRLLAYTGVHGAGFKVFAIAQTSVQIGIQTIQAYDMGRYTGSRAINVVFGLLLLLNCFAMPLAQRVFRTNQVHERMVLLLVDLFVDVVLLLVPTTLVSSYLSAYLGTDLVMFEDTYGARAVKELRLVLVVSHFNLLTKFVPSLSVYFTITNITDLLRRRPTGTTPAASQQSAYLLSSATSRRLLNQGSKTANAPAVSAVDRFASMAAESFGAGGSSTLAKWFGRLFLLWGVVVTVLYALAFSLPGTCQAGCELVLHPWFAMSKCRCAVQQIDCFDRSISGRASELVPILSKLERTGLATVIIKHCPALEVPRELHWFHDLYALEIYNCSIVSFDESAVISSAYYSRLGSLYITRTNITDIPSALLGGSLPSTLLEVGIMVSNLRTVPEDLHVKWPRVRTLYLEHGQLQNFPPVLGRMQVDTLSVYNNSIASIPDTALKSSSFNYLQLSSNPLRALPSQLGDTSALYELMIQSTDIFSLSAEWVSSAKLTTSTLLYASGSPLCGGAGDAKGLDPNTEPDRADVALTASMTALCRPRRGVYHGVNTYSYYPLEGKTLERIPQPQ